MVLPGDVITFGGRVAESGESLVRLELEAQNQKGEKVLTRAVAELTA